MRIALSSIPFNQLDAIQSDMFGQNYAAIEDRGGAVDGLVKSAVNAGVGDGFITVETRGRDDFIAYNVFVSKIRRESAGMVEATQERRVKWTEMAQAFIDKFGEQHTPPDIINCLAEVRKHFSIAVTEKLIKNKLAGI